MAIYLGFSYYNYHRYGYFQVGIHQTSHAFLARTIFTANSDARSLINPTKEVSDEAKNYHGLSLYNAYILARDQNPELDPVYVALYPSVQQVMTENGEPANPFHIAEILNEIGKGMYSQISWQSNISGFLRQYREVITLNNPKSFYPLTVVNSSVITHVQQIIAQWLQNVHITIDEVSHDENSPLVSYYRLTQNYPWYGGLIIVALLSCLYIAKYEAPIFLAPAAVFIANSILLLATRLVSFRYLVSLDVLLIMQLVLGFSMWINRRFPSTKSTAQRPLQT